jgi:hypothetical protein
MQLVTGPIITQNRTMESEKLRDLSSYTNSDHASDACGGWDVKEK